MISGDDNEDEGAVGGADLKQEQSSSSSNEEEGGGDKEYSVEKKRRKKESKIQRKVKQFWKERGRVVYGCAWQTYSASYIKEYVQQVDDLKHRIFSVVRRDHFEHITASVHSWQQERGELFQIPPFKVIGQ